MHRSTLTQAVVLTGLSSMGVVAARHIPIVPNPVPLSAVVSSASVVASSAVMVATSAVSVVAAAAATTAAAKAPNLRGVPVAPVASSAVTCQYHAADLINSFASVGNQAVTLNNTINSYTPAKDNWNEANLINTQYMAVTNAMYSISKISDGLCQLSDSDLSLVGGQYLILEDYITTVTNNIAAHSVVFDSSSGMFALPSFIKANLISQNGTVQTYGRDLAMKFNTANSANANSWAQKAWNSGSAVVNAINAAYADYTTISPVAVDNLTTVTSSTPASTGAFEKVRRWFATIGANAERDI